MQKTQNFSLNKPEAADPLRVDDFNENTDIIDRVLGELSADHIHMGTYTGDGAAKRVIPLPFTPRIALLFFRFGNNGAYTSLYLLTDSFQFYFSSDGSIGFTSTANSGCTLLENGLQVGGTSVNYKDMVDYYIAIK